MLAPCRAWQGHCWDMPYPFCGLKSSDCWWFAPFSERCGVSNTVRLWKVTTHPETNVAPENRWLEDDRLLQGWLLLVAGRVIVLGGHFGVINRAPYIELIFRVPRSRVGWLFRWMVVSEVWMHRWTKKVAENRGFGLMIGRFLWFEDANSYGKLEAWKCQKSRTDLLSWVCSPSDLSGSVVHPAVSKAYPSNRCSQSSVFPHRGRRNFSESISVIVFHQGALILHVSLIIKPWCIHNIIYYI